MKQYSILFFIKQSLNGLFMNSVMSITSIFVLMSCLILTGCSALLIFNVELNLNQLNALNKVVFFIDENYESEEEINRIKEEITSLSNVDKIVHITKEEALENFKKQFEAFAGALENESLLSNVIKDNTLPHTIEIDYKDISDVQMLVYHLQSIEGCKKVNNRADIAEFIQNIKNIVMIILIGFAVLLFVFAIFIILNTVKLSVHARRQELVIMRYIGATNFFILFPFLLEGIIIGLLSGIIAYFLQSYIYKNAVVALIKMNTGLEFMKFDELSAMLLAAFVVIGVVCGLFGSGISSRRYLKV